MGLKAEMSLEKAVEIAEDYISLDAKRKVHTYSDVREAITTLIVYSRNSIPVGCLELEKMDKELNIQTDMGGSWDYKRAGACNEILDWYHSPSFKNCLKVAHSRGFIRDHEEVKDAET